MGFKQFAMNAHHSSTVKCHDKKFNGCAGSNPMSSTAKNRTNVL